MKLILCVRITIFSVFLVALMPSKLLAADTLDKKANSLLWNSLEDRLNIAFGPENTYTLKVPMLATWVKGSGASNRDLANLAGIVPGRKFEIDPTLGERRLHDLYVSMVMDVELPLETPEKTKKATDLQKELQEAYPRFDSKREKYLERMDKAIEREQAANSQWTAKKKQSFFIKNYGIFSAELAEVQRIRGEIQRISSANALWGEYIKLVSNMAPAAIAGGDGLINVLPYDGGIETLAALEECPDDSGKTRIKLDNSLVSKSVTTNNKSGSFSFFSKYFDGKGKNGKGDYNSIISTKNEYMNLEFCNLAYISLNPSDTWFSFSLLEALHRGELKFKEGSPYKNKKILGPDGVIPRTMKGLIVARSVNMEARLSDSLIKEMKKTKRKKSGFRVGPIRIGGARSGTTFKRTEIKNLGQVNINTNSDVPVVLGVIVQPLNPAGQIPFEVE